MRISRVEIENFRNFKRLDVRLSDSVVIVGENQVGKSNLLYALRLLLDPTLRESNRDLTKADFWDGLGDVKKNHKIRISVELSGFESDVKLVALLSGYLVETSPMVAKLTYLFRTRSDVEGDPQKDSDFEYIIFGGTNEEGSVKNSTRRFMPLDVLQALRDVERDLASWSRSPLKPLLQTVQVQLDSDELQQISDEVEAASRRITDLPNLSSLTASLNSQLEKLAGASQAFETSFGIAGTNPEKLLRALCLYIDGGLRDLSESSLGAANILYLALRSLELRGLVEESERLHTFFAIEEPEAHLHPHLQRTVYREYLAERNEAEVHADSISYFLTTHSPHIASVTPLNSLVLLRKESGEGTVGVSSASLDFEDCDKADLERYLDVSRAEALFAKGVILVEGDAEKFLIPLLAARAGYDLDNLGITLCSVSGTNFLPYVKFFGPKGMNIPMAVLTDFDPYGDQKNRGEKRVHKLVTSEFDDQVTLADIAQNKHEEFGLFLNTNTFEIDFYNAGYIQQMNDSISELCTVNAAKVRFDAIAAECLAEGEMVDLADKKRFIKDIEYVGKGRFAQRVAWHISNVDDSIINCPEYILKGVQYVSEKLV